MPSVGGAADKDRGRARVDYVLGDCFGASCADAVTAMAEKHFRENGANVRRNNPYSGGYITQHYGRPAEGVHVLQIEINRSLYMDERTLRRNDGFDAVKRSVDGLIELLKTHATEIMRRR
jgi:N-formylglutamate amidohydrolase